MPTPDELRAAIAENRAAFRAALEGAAAAWEVAPASGEGEAAWSPRQVAEHAIPVEVYFASSVCDACGYPGVKWEGSKSFATATEAVEAFDAAIALANGRLKYVTETDLPKKKDDEKARTAQQWMELSAYHMLDHANQLRAAAG